MLLPGEALVSAASRVNLSNPLLISRRRISETSNFIVTGSAGPKVVMSCNTTSIYSYQVETPQDLRMRTDALRSRRCVTR